MPEDKPRYLMGVGTPSNILESVSRGVDFFDCVMPARNGRHGHLFTKAGVINIKNEKYARDDTSIDPFCTCPVCRRYSKAYLRHLFKAQEMRKFGMDMYAMVYLKWITSKDLLYSTWNSAQCDVAAWMKVRLGENGYMCMYG